MAGQPASEEVRRGCAADLAVPGASITGVAAGRRISRRSLQRWVNEDPAFQALVERATADRDARDRKAQYDYARRHNPDAIDPDMKPEYGERGARTGHGMDAAMEEAERDVRAAHTERQRVAMTPAPVKELSDAAAQELWRLNVGWRAGRYTHEQYDLIYDEIVLGKGREGRQVQVRMIGIPLAAEAEAMLAARPPDWTRDPFAGSYA